MSCLLTLLNRLKAQANPGMLTDSQIAVYETILDHWRFPQRVNLYGPPGSGRTFLAWAISRSQGVPFCVSPNHLPESEKSLSCIVVDNVVSTERTIRDLLARLQLYGAYKALLVTDRCIDLSLAPAELSAPSADDFDVVYHNLSLLDYYALEPIQQGNLWEAIYSVCTS
jgi:hypothetical protein